MLFGLHRSRSVFLIALCALFILTPVAIADEAGTITGRVETIDGGAVSDAEIDLVDLRLHVHTDDDGRFSFENVPPGNYLLRAESLVGDALTQRVELASGGNVDVTITLTVVSHDDEVVITGSAIPRSQLELAQPTTVLTGEDLRDRLQPTLGETLAQEPGVSSTFFGQTASRPVIRGIGGDRIRILQGGVDVGDVFRLADARCVNEPAVVEVE